MSDQLNPTEAQKEIEKLRAEIEHHNRLYYIDVAPQISDREFDLMLRRLTDLEKEFPQFQDPDSPTQRVGGEPLKGFENAPHAVPMMSLDNLFTKEAVVAYAEKYGGPFVLEPKIDGISISVRYKNGRFVQALTRGDGKRGDNVSANLKTIKSLPLRLNCEHPPTVFEVRGEVYMTRHGFAALNEERQEKGQTVFANPRNACAGSMKLLDPREVANRPLNALFYAVGELDGIEFSTHRDLLDTLKQFGFKTSLFCPLCETGEELWEQIEELDQKRHEFEYEIDGAVIKINDRTRYSELGGTAKFPHWATAYKYAPEQAETTLKDITVQIGRTGVLTPVAELEPVHLAGTVVKRATLHNEDEIKRKDIRIGDRIIVEKAGEIIPAVVRVVTEKRSGEEKPFDMRIACEALGIQPVKREGEVAWRIEDLQHPAMLKRWVTHFASRNAMDIDGLGESIVELLVDNQLIQDPADLYDLKKDQLLRLEGFKEKKAANLIAGIEKSKNQPFDRILFALGIRHIGSGAARILAAEFGDIETLMTTSPEDLEAIRDIGPVAAESICSFFRLSKNRERIKRLEAAGVYFTQTDRPKSGKLNGLTFVLTGSLNSMSREEAGEEVRAHGGTVSSSVSKKTDYVVCGEKAGSKRAKAESLGVNILSEEEFLNLIDHSAKPAPEPGQMDMF